MKDCFQKTAPATPVYKFPTAIEIRYPVIPERNNVPGYITPDNKDTMEPYFLYANPLIIGRGQESEISYTLTGEGDKKPVDPTEPADVHVDDALLERGLRYHAYMRYRILLTRLLPMLGLDIMDFVK